jgi:hypothetical protein
MSKDSGSELSTDIKVVNDNSPGKGLAEPRLSTRRRTHLLLAAGGLGLLLLGLGVGLAIGLPLAMQNKRRADALQLSAGGSGIQALKGTTRTYYLAAEPIDWDYAPAGKNLCTGKAFESEDELKYTKQGIGTKYKKAVYRQYKDDSFKVRGGGALSCFLRGRLSWSGLCSIWVGSYIRCQVQVQGCILDWSKGGSCCRHCYICGNAVVGLHVAYRV